MYSPTPPPPVPPPKPTSHDVSRLSTPASGTPPRPSPIPEGLLGSANGGRSSQAEHSGLILAPSRAVANTPEDPGDRWLPKVLEDKSKQDLADILGDPKLLQALTRAPMSAHPSVAASDEALLAALDENVALGKHLLELEARLVHQRSSAQAQLLSTHALERQWRQKQAEMDHALQPFAAPALYQQLTQSLQEQEMICQAMEESFLEGDGSGLATEREMLDWVRRYREAKKLYYLRQERKERWNERRVGGWR